MFLLILALSCAQVGSTFERFSCDEDGLARIPVEFGDDPFVLDCTDTGGCLESYYLIDRENQQIIVDCDGEYVTVIW